MKISKDLPKLAKEMSDKARPYPKYIYQKVLTNKQEIDRKNKLGGQNG